MQVTREEHQRRSGANMFINGGVAKNNHKNGGEEVRMRRLSKFTNPALIAATAAAIMLFSAAPFAAGQEQDGLLLQGNGPGPAANEAGPGCNIIPPLASIGTKVNIKQFPPADSLTDAELAGPVQLLKSGKFDIPIEKLIKVNVPPGTPRGTIRLPLFKGAVKTSSGLKPAWYIILDAGDKEEAERLGVNFSKKLHNAGDAARPATLRDDGTFLFESGLVDFSPNRQVQAGSNEKPFPPSIANPGSVGDADYSPLVRANGIVYDAPVIAAAVDDAQINFPNGDPDYGLVHDQVISIDPANRQVTLSLINGYSLGSPSSTSRLSQAIPLCLRSRGTPSLHVCAKSRPGWTTSSVAPSRGSSSRRMGRQKAAAKIRSVRVWAPRFWTGIGRTTRLVAFPRLPPITAQSGTPTSTSGPLTP